MRIESKGRQIILKVFAGVYFVLINTVLTEAAAMAASQFSFRQDHVLGTSFEMMVFAENNTDAEKAWWAAQAKINELDSILSTWRNDSEISHLNRVKSMTVSSSLFEVLSLCEHYRGATKEAVSCRIGQLIQAWQQAKKNDNLPEQETLLSLSTAILSAPLKIEADKRRINRPANIVFAVDSIAKGWILDRAGEAALATSENVKGVLLNIGGDLRIVGDVADHVPRIGLAGPGAGDNEPPMETIVLDRGAIATSGDGKRDLTIAGRRYSHILSPITGQPQKATSVVTVFAPTAAQADVLATAFSTMGVGRSLAYANSHDGVEAVIVTTGGGRFASRGWSLLLAPVEKKSAVDAGIDNPWPAGYVMNIEYKVPKIAAANYEAPYVAIWVTDAKKKLVRSLLLLGNKPRWLEENHRFWRRYGRKQAALVDSIAQPTRQPGQYQLVWDGRDDDGAPVPQGAYILHVESSREHGGHSYIRQNLQLMDDVVEAILPAQAEIGEVLLHYGSQE